MHEVIEVMILDKKGESPSHELRVDLPSFDQASDEQVSFCRRYQKHEEKNHSDAMEQLFGIKFLIHTQSAEIIHMLQPFQESFAGTALARISF